MLDTSSSEGPQTLSIFRPVQYLGSKLRALDFITQQIAEKSPLGGTVWDPFTGSTVVAQAIAACGFRVAATDALCSSALFATALLGVNRSDAIDISAADVIEEVSHGSHPANRATLWSSWLQLEEEALARNDGHLLLEISASLPQRWRLPKEATEPALLSHFHSVNRAAEQREYTRDGLISATYAGTYFGLAQSLRIEQIRAAIETLHQARRITSWQRAACITALCGAASSASYSAGKHFAQPHRIRSDKDLTFHARRILSDRAIDIDAAFRSNIIRIAASARPGLEGHTARRLRTEDVTAAELVKNRVQAVYADPPYTAQQYSRFYHVLEVISDGRPSNLQTVRGAITRGLYPDDKYLSPFCSRKNAPAAFEHLIGLARAADANTYLSYSASSSGSTGNARTVTLDWLESRMKAAYGSRRVHTEKLDIRYRQFNSGSLEVPMRDDPEYLIVGEC